LQYRVKVGSTTSRDIALSAATTYEHNDQSCLVFFQIYPFSKSCLPSNYKVYVYIVKHNYILGVKLFTIRKAQLYISALNVCHLHVVQLILISQIYKHL